MERERVLPLLADELAARLGAELVGCYALPSSGPPAPPSERFVVVTADRLHGDAELAVRAAHRALPGTPVLDGGYAPSSDLRSPMTVGRAWPGVAPGSAELLASARGNTVQDRWLLRHAGRALVGPDPAAVVHEVGADALRAEALGLARARAERIEQHPELLADAAYRRELVGALCQVLHTAHRARVVLPEEAAGWAVDEVPASYRTLVAGEDADAALVRALTWEVHRMVGAEVLRHSG
jgi:hypothetical protein